MLSTVAPVPTEDDKPRRRPQWLPMAIGVAAFAAAVGFLTWRVRGQWSEISAALGNVGWATVVGGVALSAAGMVFVAVSWYPPLADAGCRRSRKRVTAWYFAGEIGKYIPGGIWPVVGRGELAHRSGIPRSKAYGSVAVSLTALLVANASLVILGSPWLSGGVVVALCVAAAIGAAAAGTLMLLPVLHARLPRRVRSLVDRSGLGFPARAPSLRDMLTLDLVAWGCIGGASVVFASAVSDSASPVGVAVAMLASWLIGFLIVPVPGGLGVREAVFVAAASGLSDAEALTVALLARTSLVLVDLVGAGAGAMVLLRRPLSRQES